MTHGQSQTRLYGIWANMKARCANLNDKHYGARGITVCAEWERFEAFRDWALANGYADHLTIDRKENNHGYSPDNCQWATRAEQAVNRRNVTPGGIVRVSFSMPQFLSVAAQRRCQQLGLTMSGYVQWLLKQEEAKTLKLDYCI